MALRLKAPESSDPRLPRIAVLGVGGAGGNAVNNMIEAKLQGVEFLVANTDAQALGRSRCKTLIQLGRGVTHGLGSGSQPDVGRAAAEETLDELRTALEGFHMVFITAGMGGGTGTGSTPVIAQAARENGSLTIGVTTKPFTFEGPKRMRVAETGLQELHRHLDTLLVIPNQNLFQVADKETTFAEAFRIADRVLQDAVRAVSDLIVRPGLINLDFADVRAVVSGMGRAMMGAGEAEGDGRAVAAAEAAIANPLLEGLAIEEVRALLVNVAGGDDLTLHEIESAVGTIGKRIDPSVNTIFGSTLDADLDGRIRVSIVATGERPAAAGVREAGPRGPKLSLVADRGEAAPAAADPPAVPPAELAAGAEPDHATADPPETPEEDAPEAEAPATEAPEADTPTTDTPEADTPDESAGTSEPEAAVEQDEVVELDEYEEAIRATGEPGFMGRLMSGLSGSREELFQRAERCYHGYGVSKDLKAPRRMWQKRRFGTARPPNRAT
jgi:cell division protein FtsZ